MRWPDVAVGVGCVLVIGALLGVMIGPTSPRLAPQVEIQWQLRSIHQTMLLYGLDNNRFLPGLNPDGTLLTNDPAERYELLVAGRYLTSDFLRSPADARPDAAYSYALLDISTPGARRGAWTTEAAPDAPILAESPASLGLDGPAEWSGWVLWHSAYLAAETAAESAERVQSSRLRTRYTPDGQFNDDDDLFAAQGPDDAYLLSPKP